MLCVRECGQLKIWFLVSTTTMYVVRAFCPQNWMGSENMWIKSSVQGIMLCILLPFYSILIMTPLRSCGTLEHASYFGMEILEVLGRMKTPNYTQVQRKQHKNIAACFRDVPGIIGYFTGVRRVDYTKPFPRTCRSLNSLHSLKILESW